MDSEYPRQKIAATGCFSVLTLWVIVLLSTLAIHGQGVSDYDVALFMHICGILFGYCLCIKKSPGGGFIVLMLFINFFFGMMTLMGISKDGLSSFLNSELSIVLKFGFIAQIAISGLILVSPVCIAICYWIYNCLYLNLAEESIHKETDVKTAEKEQEIIPMIQVVTIAECPPLP